MVLLTQSLIKINKIFPNKNVHSARHQWLMPVILTTQEVEIRRSAVQSQLGK
jgi:hypothetical protein